MKRIIVIIFTFLMVNPLPILAEQDIFKLHKADYPIEVDGKEIKSELPILNYNGNTYVPLSFLGRLLGSYITWDKDNNKVKIYTLLDYLNKFNYSIEPEIDSAVDMESFKSAPEQVDINNLKYTLQTHIYKDFMPMKDKVSVLEGGTTIYILEDNGERFSQVLEIQDIWFVFKGKAWKLKYISDDTIKFIDKKIALSRRSPSFPSFANNTAYDASGERIDSDAGKVDVVVKIADKNNKTYLLKAKNQEIHSTW